MACPPLALHHYWQHPVGLPHDKADLAHNTLRVLVGTPRVLVGNLVGSPRVLVGNQRVLFGNPKVLVGTLAGSLKVEVDTLQLC